MELTINRKALTNRLLKEPKRYPLSGAVLTFLALGVYLLVFQARETGLIPPTLLPVLIAGWFFGWQGSLLMGLATLLPELRWMHQLGRDAPLAKVLLIRLPVVVLLGVLVGVLQEARAKLLKANEKIQENEKRFQFLTENARVGLYMVRNNKLVYANPELVRLFGYEPEEIIGQWNPLELVHPDDQEPAQENLLRRMSGEAIPPYTFRAVRKDGSTFHGEALGQLAEYQGQRVIIGTLLDVTERVRTEKQLRLQAAALASAPDGIVIANLEGRVEWVNPAVTHLTGYAPEEVVGEDACLFLSEEQHPHYYQELWSTILAGKKWYSDLINRRKDGSTYLAELSITPILDEKKSITHFVGIMKDITERHEAQKRIQVLNHDLERQLSHLTALRKIDQAITSTSNLAPALSALIEAVRQELMVDAASVLLFRPYGQVLEFVAGQGFRSDKDWYPSGLRLGTGPAGKAALERRIIHTADPAEISILFPDQENLREEGFVMYWAVPLVAKGELQGVMEVFRRTASPPDKDWWEFLGILAGQAASAISGAMLFRELRRSNHKLRRAYDDNIEGWSRALDLRDKETEGHSQRVTDMTVRLAKRIGVSDEELVHVRRGALLHDIGKMGVPDHILLKPGKLSDEEWGIMKRHPELAYELLAPIEFLAPALDIPYCHHEKWDGSGYPQGLKGKTIPLAARIFAVIDVYDALTSDRPYREAWSRERALDYIREESGKHFDPEVVEQFIKLMQEKPPTSPPEPTITPEKEVKGSHPQKPYRQQQYN